MGRREQGAGKSETNDLDGGRDEGEAENSKQGFSVETDQEL